MYKCMYFYYFYSGEISIVYFCIDDANGSKMNRVGKKARKQRQAASKKLRRKTTGNDELRFYCLCISYFLFPSPLIETLNKRRAHEHA